MTMKQPYSFYGLMEQVRFLCESSDFNKLPPSAQIKIKQLDRQLRYFECNLQANVAMLNEAFNDVRKEVPGIARLLEGKD